MNKKEIIKWVGTYFLFYIAVVTIYGFCQWLFVCQDMNGFVCNFKEDKLLNFLTVISYIVTPTIAIIGYLNWKQQIIYPELIKYIFELKKNIHEYKQMHSAAMSYVHNNFSHISYKFSEMILFQSELMLGHSINNYNDYNNNFILDIRIRQKEDEIRKYFDEIYNKDVFIRLNDNFKEIYSNIIYIDQILKQKNFLESEFNKIDFLLITREIGHYKDLLITQGFLITPFFQQVKEFDSLTNEKEKDTNINIGKIEKKYFNSEAHPLDEQFNALIKKIDSIF